MRRRDMIAVLGGAAIASSPLVRAQQRLMPQIAYLSSGYSLAGREKQVDGLRKGLAETGYIVGNNVSLTFHWAGDKYEHLAPMAAEVARQQPAVIVTPQLAAALAMKEATATIPIVFLVGDNPVKHGLAASLNHPGGNATGMSMLAVGLVAKRLQFLRELMPDITSLALLVNPTNPNVSAEIAEVQDASKGIGGKIEVVKASTSDELEKAFASLAAAGAKGLVVGPDPFFNSRRGQIVDLAARFGIAAIYEWREFVERGGLASYGTNLGEAMHQLGIYVGRILKGEKAPELPIVQPTTFELVINLTTAKALGLTVPQSLLARADEVIE